MNYYKTQDELEEKSQEALGLMNNKDVVATNIGPTIGKRHQQALILCILLTCCFVIRTALTVAIVAMTDPTASSNKDIPTYNWDDKSLVMASFLWGYFIPQVAAGYFSDKYGGKWFLVVSAAITATAGLLIPSAALYLGSKGVMVCRFLQGLSQGFLFPSLHATCGKWIPVPERSRLGTFVYTGATLGVCSSLILTGYISSSRYGWPMVFYSFNTIALIVVALYAYIGTNDPSSHPTITEEEKNYIINSLNTATDRRNLSVPWKEMLTSKALIAVLMTNICCNFTHWLFISETSIYFDKIMHLELKSNSILIALPYIVEVFIGFGICFIADYLHSKNIISITAIRKIMNNIAMLIPAVATFLLTTAGPNDKNYAIFCMILVNGCQGAGKSGHVVNHMDLAPNFSGIMMGFTNGLSVGLSSFAPVLTHFIVRDENNISQWRIIFYVTVGINIFGGIYNTLFTSAKRQPWNEGKNRKEDFSQSDAVI
ncbi:putative inorganic phosphate cotransporter isoform X2 [Diabrotica virgifera virgifera]|uniref:Major facilitator superfamily (MFS) profile domain-containing protein n=2 Tax=Diabrotica virgifera virgifera TaxID=50390 RepID=A0ABM5KFL1_DIAVI|nr:putative inorganic phosphate cotransporter isoform X2 [Diabrotica virgifera virgifera]